MAGINKLKDANHSNKNEEKKNQEHDISRLLGPPAVFWVVLGAFASAALGILISVILAKYGTQNNWMHALSYSILCYALISFLFSTILFRRICKKAEEIEERDLNHAIELEKHLNNANSLYEKIQEKSRIFETIANDIGKIKSACEGQEKHINAIIEAAEKMSGALITIDEAVRIEHEAEDEVYIISVDPRLETKPKFYDVVCHNILREICYTYFFPNSNPVKIERAWKKLVDELKEYKSRNQENKKIDESLLRQRLKIYVVNPIHIISNIILIDPNRPAKTKCWVFPIIENENLIVSAGQLLIEKAIEQAREWMDPKAKYLKYPSGDAINAAA